MLTQLQIISIKALSFVHKRSVELPYHSTYSLNGVTKVRYQFFRQLPPSLENITATPIPLQTPHRKVTGLSTKEAAK